MENDISMLSVVIIARNEASLIKACIDSVKWADEIIVVDNDSSDQTANVARESGARVVSYVQDVVENFLDRTKLDFSDIRNVGLEASRGEWILYVDADERVLKPLREEIDKIIDGQTTTGAWAIPRKNIILGEEKRYAAFWPDYVIRFFKKTHLKGWHGRVHEQPIFEGRLEKFENFLLHLTHRDIDSMVMKSLEWAEVDAKLRLEAKHPKMTGARFLRIFLTEIWNQGILRRGFFNGSVGVIDSITQVFSLFISYVKLWQLQHHKKLAEIYKEIDQDLIKNGFNYK